jgi:hypothetical protein
MIFRKTEIKVIQSHPKSWKVTPSHSESYATGHHAAVGLANWNFKNAKNLIGTNRI